MKKTQKRPLHRALAMTMAAALICAALPLGALATDECTSATITKKVTKEANTYAPNTSFSFAVANGAAIPQDNILAGVTGGAVMGSAVSFSPAAGDIGKTLLSGSTSITFNPGVFSKPGIYRYTVTENSGSYDGITYDTTVKDLLVYVANGQNGFVIDGYTISDSSGTKNDAFTNDYGATNGLVNELTITNTVTGNQGDQTKPFTYTLTMTPAETGEKYLLILNGDTANPIEVSTTAVQFTLTHGQSAVLYGLSSGDAFSVVQTDYSGEGYTTTADLNDVPASGLTVSGSITADGQADFVNDRSVTPPTGLVQEKAPYLVMLIVAAGLVALILFRRRDHE